MTTRIILRYTSVLAVVLLTLAGCAPVEKPADVASAYRSVWAELYPASLAKQPAEGTLYGDFYHAAASQTQTMAERRWERFLSDWMPANGEFEDASHARFVNWAKLEIQRLQYLKQENISAAEMTRRELRQTAADIE